ncbi:MAG: class I SAM-dependent methyltransferase [Candidatus Diapherotrites archaeon]|uniref:Class I SAM-dependent methyltransferase n=1 Tax=Candidatus Iainarchaeum sp. TaxID=3101447 RepID=A0A938YT71_9ARCH|nr:class I SAM-dependent methyltransferase [Candidatus Diapherotrites archaeon]
MKSQDYYDDFSRNYDWERLHGYFGFINEMEAATIKPLVKGKQVLEIGCGTGLIMRQIAGLEKNAVGIDISQKMLSKAREKGFAVARADAAKLPFRDESFDVVYSFKVLAHIEDIGPALSEAARVAKGKGFVVLEFYNSQSIKKLMNFFVPKKVFIRYDSPGRIKRLLPDQLSVHAFSGIRIISPAAISFRIPIVSGITKAVERLLSKTPLSRFGSYFIVICRKN